MAKTVRLFGTEVPRGYVIAGGAVVAAAAVYGWRKNKQQAAANTAAPSAPSAPSSAATGDLYPPDGTTGNPSDPYSTDPATGTTYGDEGGAFATGYGALTDYGYGGGYGGSFYPPGVTGTPTYTTNGQWSQAAEDYLVNTVGADSVTVAAALGKYVTGQAVTDAQMSVIEQAIAFAGYPPQNGPDGYPPSIKQGPTPPPPPPGTTGSTVSGGHVVSVSNNRAVVAWTPHGPAKQWQVKVSGPNLNGRTGTVNVPQASFSGLAAGHDYGVTVTPLPSGKPGTITFKTTR